MNDRVYTMWFIKKIFIKTQENTKFPLHLEKVGILKKKLLLHLEKVGILKKKLLLHLETKSNS